jgi:hypothetical protein
LYLFNRYRGCEFPLPIKHRVTPGAIQIQALCACDSIIQV